MVSFHCFNVSCRRFGRQQQQQHRLDQQQSAGSAGQYWCAAAEAAKHRQGPCSGLGPGFGRQCCRLGTVQMLGRAGSGQPGIPKVPLRHAGHLSWGRVSQHSWSLPSTLCSEVVAPGAWVCVFGLVLVEALLSVWLALWGWSLACGPLLPDSPPLWMPVVSGSLLSVLSLPVLAGPAKGPFLPFRCWGPLRPGGPEKILAGVAARETRFVAEHGGVLSLCSA